VGHSESGFKTSLLATANYWLLLRVTKVILKKLPKAVTKMKATFAHQ